MKIKTFILLGVVFSLFNACVYRKADPSPAPVVVEDPVDFQQEIKPILTQHCIVCHSASSVNSSRPGYAFFDEEADLKTYATTKSSSNPSYTLIQARVRGLGGRQMPLNASPLSDGDIQKIDRWIEQGAPIN